MRLIRQTRLAYREGKSDKVYEVDLCEVGENQYVVNFRYGRRGANLKDGTKTVLPVPQDKAEKLFDQLVNSKKKKGYWDTDQEPPQEVKATAPTEVKIHTEGLSKRKKILLTQLQNAVTGTGFTRRRLERLVWRVGEMRLNEAAPLLLKLVDNRHPLVQYCLAWSLGCCGDASALPYLKYVFENKDTAGHVRRMAMEAFRALCPEPERTAFLNEIENRLPQPFKDALAKENPDEFREQLEAYLKKAGGPADFYVLSDLYLLEHKVIHQALLEFLKTVPMKPRYFKAFRRLFKAAEFRMDARTYGILVRRMEKERHYASISDWGEWGWADTDYIKNIKKELKQPDSKAAYTNVTRAYLRRRAWRTLKRLAQLDDENYVRLAVGVLLAISDEDAAQPDTYTYYDWENAPDWSNVQTITFHYDIYANYFCFNHILYGNSPRYTPSPASPRWKCKEGYQPGQPVPDAREESFPHLWDQQPRGLLHLLSDSRCREVHGFAVKALRVNREFLEKLDAEALHMMLSAPYTETQQLGLELARRRLETSGPDIELLAALLTCPLAEARTLARDIISGPGFPQDMAEALLRRSIDYLLTLTEEEQSDLASELADLLRLVFAPQLRRLEMDLVLKLLEHPLPVLKGFAVHILADHEIPPEQLPGDIILGFCLSPLAEVRRAVAPILEKLAASNPEFGALLAQTLAHHLLKKEPHDGFYNDLSAMLTAPLRQSLSAIDKALMLRLLKSRATVVQGVGAQLLKGFYSASDFSTRDITGFLSHDILEVRELARQWCRENVPQFKSDIKETVRMFDSDWEDAREFAFGYFREFFGKEDLGPDILVAVCDSVRPDVQRFGTDMINRFFEEEDGPVYMVKLSQHPSTNLQLFVTNYLARYASGSAKRIEELYPYFTMVLSQVNKARAAKKRIYAFLKEQAMKDREIAAMVTRLMSRISATIAIGDKAACIELLRDIGEVYPDIGVPLSKRPVEVRRGAAELGGAHGV
jgi:predicted DNA-binding WGR domain protein